MTKEQVAQKQEVTQTVEEKAKEVKTEVKVEEKKVEEAKSEEPKQVNETTSNELNAETLFKTCASCHGLKGEKEALGKSQVITGWDKDREKMVYIGMYFGRPRDRKSTRLNSSHITRSRMPSSA